jgi:hypothetical protein
MRPLGKRLERLSSVLPDLSQHVDPHPLDERLADGDVEARQVRNDLLRLGLHAESGQGVLDGPAAIGRSMSFLVHRLSDGLTWRIRPF